MGEQLALDFTASVSVRTRKAKRAQEEADQQTLFAAWVPNIDIHLHSPLEAVASITGSNPERAHLWLQGLTGGIRVITGKRVAFPTAALDKVLYIRPPAHITLDAAATAVGRAIWARKLGFKPMHVRRERQRLLASSPRWPGGFRVKDAPWTAIATCIQLGIPLNIEPSARRLMADKIAAAGGKIAHAGLAGSAVVLEASQPSLLEGMGIPGLAYSGEAETGMYKVPLLAATPLLDVPGIEMSKDLIDAIRKAASKTKPLQTQADFPWTLYPFQAEDAGRGLRILETTGGALLAGDMGSGKDLECSTILLSPTGTVVAGEVKEGDFLVGRDGKPTQVLGVYPQGVKEVFRVTFTDKTTAYAGAGHLWAVQSPVMKKRTKRSENVRSENVTAWKILSTQELLEGRLRDGAGNLRWYIPMCDPVQFENPAPEIPGYAIGALLGDGSLSIKNQLGFTSGDQFIVDEIARELNLEVRLAPMSDTTRQSVAEERGCAPEDVRDCSYRIISPVPLYKKLEALGMAGKRAWEKSIPDEYKYAPEDVRRAVLQGLMDTDGGLAPGGPSDGRQSWSSIEFTSTSEQLADDLVWLVQSLGGTARKNKPVRKTYTYKGEKKLGRPAWRVSLQLPNHVAPFRLPRKADLHVPCENYLPARGIESIESVRFAETVCFQVDAVDKLFLLGNCAPTHNTTVALALAAELELWPLLIIAPLSAFSTWARQLEEMNKRYFIATGSLSKCWEELSEVEYDAVVISYDRLHAFTELVDRMHFAGSIADEVQRIRNPGSRRSRALRTIASQMPYRIGLSGTPMVNGLGDLLPLGAYMIPSEWPPRATEKDLADLYPGDPVEAVAEHLGSYMVRRKMKDTGAILPKRNDRRVLVELTPEQRRALEDLQREAEEAKENGEFDGSNAKFNALVKLTRMRQIVANPRKAGLQGPNPKIESAMRLIKEYHSQGRKQVVFCTDRATWQDLRDELRLAGLRAEGMWGGTSAQERIDIEKRLHAGELDVVFCTTQSSSESWSASPTCTVYQSLGYLYNPAVLAQAEARVLRLSSDPNGPEVEVVYHHATCPGGSPDDRFVEILDQKRQLISQVIDRESYEDNTEVHLNLGDLVYVLTGSRDTSLQKTAADRKRAAQAEQDKKLHARQSIYARKGKNKTAVETFKDRGESAQTIEEYHAASAGDVELDEMLADLDLSEDMELHLEGVLDGVDEFDVEDGDDL